MLKFSCEKLLSYSFSEKELKTLQKNQEFIEWSKRIETLDQFEQLCVFGFDLLEQESVLSLTDLDASQSSWRRPAALRAG